MRNQIVIATALVLLTYISTPALAHRSAPVQAAYGVDIAAIPAYPFETTKTASTGGPRRVRGHRVAPQARPRTGVWAATTGGLVRVRLDSGQTIVVAARYADRFAGFLNALYHREGRLPEVSCYSPTGHMRNSLHHWGGACDVDQRARNVAWRPMYHVAALAAQYGLTDGCSWHNPDCGHVDVSGVGGGHYARRTRYASHHHHHRYAFR
jgi:hypothetical protein